MDKRIKELKIGTQVYVTSAVRFESGDNERWMIKYFVDDIYLVTGLRMFCEGKIETITDYDETFGSSKWNEFTCTHRYTCVEIKQHIKDKPIYAMFEDTRLIKEVKQNG